MSLVARSVAEALRQAPTVRVELLLVADSALSDATIREVFPIDYSSASVQILTGLTRSSLDFVTVFGARASVLKLPLLADIFDLAHRHGRGDYVVFTNTDIIPAPDFYAFVAHRVREMHPRHGPSLDITRRDINASADIGMSALHQLSGVPHPGRDCWVLPRAWAPKLSLSALFLGFRYAEPLLINLHYFSRHHAHKAHQQVTDAFVTRHLMHAGANTRTRQLAYSVRDEYSRVQAVLGLYRRYGDDFVAHSVNSSLAPFARAVRGLIAGTRLKSQSDVDMYFYKLTIVNQSILLY
jgi:hypothetical protein